MSDSDETKIRASQVVPIKKGDTLVETKPIQNNDVISLLLSAKKVSEMVWKLFGMSRQGEKWNHFMVDLVRHHLLSKSWNCTISVFVIVF